MRWLNEILLDLTKTNLFINLKDTHKDFLSRQSILNKKDQAIYLGNSCSLMGQIDNLNFYNIIFL